MSARPQLAVVVDTEEEFDWAGAFSRENVATRSIPAQALAHEIYDPLGVVPTYVVDYPVATDAASVAFLGALRASGRAEIGAHLHGWVTPPHEEALTRRNSYQCNLPPDLERAKIECLTAAIAGAFGARPTVFKAGRYGFGPHTAAVLRDLGYTVDCSFVPFASFAADGGPTFHGVSDRPFWLDAGRTLLEVPLTSGFFGRAAGAGEKVQALFDDPRAGRLRLPGILSRAGLVTRSRLTPEGVPAEEQCRLLAALAKRGRRMFTLTYHSPSLAPGNTPYVRSGEDLARFLDSIATVLRFFREEIGGEFTTLSRYRTELDAAGTEAA